MGFVKFSIFIIILGYSLVTNSQSFEKNRPNNIDNLIDHDINYSVVLFQYLQKNYQEALNELVLINTANLTPDELKYHKHLNQLLIVNNGQTFFDTFLSISKNEVAIQSLLMAVNQQIDNKNWQQANQLFKLLPKQIPEQLYGQYSFLLGQLTLESQSNQFHTKPTTPLNDNSLEYALLLQHQSIKDDEPSLSLLNQLISLNNMSFIDIKNNGLLAIGYRFLAKGDAKSAVIAFKNISLNSLSNNAGSLGLGLAFNQLKQFNNARKLLNRVNISGDPGAIFYESQLADAFALEQLGDEQGALNKLTQVIYETNERLNNLPDIERYLTKQSPCFFNLLSNVLLNQCNLKGEELNEQFLLLLSSQNFINIANQIKNVTKLELKYNQQLETLMSFNYLLNHQIKLTNELLNDVTMRKLKSDMDNVAQKKMVVVKDVEHAKNTNNGHFFLSDHYIALQARIDEVFKSMVFLKRSGQKNIASERRVTLMQRILWWESYSNLSNNIEKTKNSIDKLNQQLIENESSYDVLEGYVNKAMLMSKKLETVLMLDQQIQHEKATLAAVKQTIINEASRLINKFIIEQKVALEKVFVNAHLAKLRIEDASFKRDLDKEKGGKQ